LNLIHVDEDMQYASLLLVNANVTTLNPAEPKARAVAVKGGEILDVGTTKHMLKCATKEIVGGKITYKNPKSDIEAQVYERKIE